MRPPCELIVRYVLPAFRSLLAKELSAKYKLSQVVIADNLGITQAAVSHYLYSKRGNKKIQQLQSLSEVRSMASEVAEKIASGEISKQEAMLKFCKLCAIIRKNGTLNKLQEEANGALEGHEMYSSSGKQ